MTQNEKNNHLLRFQRFQQSREIYFAPKINAALNSQYKTFIHNVRRLGVEAVNHIKPDGITKILENLYFDAGIVYGAKIRADLNRVKARMPIGFSERMHQLIMEYFGQDILNTSLGITETTKKLIRDVFINAYAQGLGIDDIIKQFEDTEMSRIRSRLIARTETVTSANGGALIVAKETGLLLNKTWLATKDSRTRHDHAEVDGHTVGRDDYFDVGGSEMLYPGDRGGKDGKPEVPASEIVNCRCTTIFAPMRDANGRLLRA
jgi:hypothetical protein